MHQMTQDTSNQTESNPWEALFKKKGDTLKLAEKEPVLHKKQRTVESLLGGRKDQRCNLRDKFIERLRISRSKNA